MRYKICPNCGERNPVEELLCEGCMADLSNAMVVEVLEETRRVGELTRVEVKERLILKHDKFFIEVLPGDVVGRHAKGGEYLKDYLTVSRRHVKFYKEADGWYVEDLNSTNGTYVNERRINTRVRVANGDVISLSSSVSFIVVIE